MRRHDQHWRCSNKMKSLRLRQSYWNKMISLWLRLSHYNDTNLFVLHFWESFKKTAWRFGIFLWTWLTTVQTVGYVGRYPHQEFFTLYLWTISFFLFYYLLPHICNHCWTHLIVSEIYNWNCPALTIITRWLLSILGKLGVNLLIAQ